MPPAVETSRAERLARIDHAHVWHPFTPMRQWRQEAPLIIDRAERFELIDVDGRRYIDGHGSLWCNVHGHRVPELDRAVQDQLGKIAHGTMLGAATVPAIELAERLVNAANSGAPADDARQLTKVFYSDAGATATELAFKMAVGRHHHRGEPQRDTLVALEGAYHGDTVGAMSVGYSEAFHRPFLRLTFHCEWTASPDPRRFDDGSDWPSWRPEAIRAAHRAALGALRDTLDRVGDRCAGVVIEPVMQGAAGMVRHPDGFLRDVAAEVRRRGLLLIADEVAVGFSRTGSLFACAREGVRPDILCLAKGVSGGYLPLAATLCNEDISRSFEGDIEEGRTLFHGHTYTGNPLACAAALASIDLIERDGLPARAASHEHMIRSRLREALADHPNVGDVRTAGVMTGVELVSSRDPWRPHPPQRRAGHEICGAARERGAVIRPLGDVVILNPAPAMDEATLSRLLDILIEAIQGFDFPPHGR